MRVYVGAIPTVCMLGIRGHPWVNSVYHVCSGDQIQAVKVGPFRNDSLAWTQEQIQICKNVPKRNTGICCSASTLLNGAEWVTHGTAAVTSVSDPWFLPRSGWLSNLLMCCVGRPTMGVSTPTCRLFSDHYSLKGYHLLSISYLEIIKIYGRICVGDI